MRLVLFTYEHSSDDTIDRHRMWQMVRVHGVRVKILKEVQSFYLDSKAQECIIKLGDDLNSVVY